jgi:hypothetical protein
LGAGRGAFFRFIVFLLFSFLSSWARISPAYRLSQIADKALTFDGCVVHRELRSHLAYEVLTLCSDLNLVFLRELNLNCRNGSRLARLAHHFGSDLDFCDAELVSHELPATYLDHVHSLGYNTASSFHGEFLAAIIRSCSRSGKNREKTCLSSKEAKKTKCVQFLPSQACVVSFNILLLRIMVHGAEVLDSVSARTPCRSIHQQTMSSLKSTPMVVVFRSLVRDDEKGNGTLTVDSYSCLVPH